ncbi:hypothetical protein LIER_39686 [Lithospermum erythrorhizon]|uniref:Uncharacterized protein n=1 Tax=Lithospermum erythrorhizon TaxID=34254 RepID=A0AAV3QLP1_LITER
MVLQDEHGASFTKAEEIQQLATDFYQALFTSESPLRNLTLYNLNTKKLSPVQRINMDKAFLPLELKNNVFSIKGTKAPGPDGMSGHFF